MPAKKKNNKGTEMSLSDFQGDSAAKGGEHDWAESQWEPEREEVPQVETASGMKPVNQLTAAELTKYHEMRYNHEYTKLGRETNFRDAEGKVPDNMAPPYVAHLGNLKTGITKEDLCAEFFPDKIKECRLITRDGRSTFAFLEFIDVRTLQLVMLMDQRVVQGRKVHIDVASQEQISRMTQHRDNAGGGGGAGFGKRFGGSTGTSGLGLDSLDRDKFGTGSPEPPAQMGGGGRGGFRQGFGDGTGPMAAGAFGDFRSGPQLIQRGGGGSMQDLDNWRDSSDVAAQPEFPNEEGGNNNNNSKGSRAGMGSNRRGGSRSPLAGGAPSFRDSPTPQGEGAKEPMGNWRDAPQVQQPELQKEKSGEEGAAPAPRRTSGTGSANRRPPQSPSGKNPPSSTSGSNTSSAPAPTTSQPTPAAQPASPAAAAQPPRAWAAVAASSSASAPASSQPKKVLTRQPPQQQPPAPSGAPRWENLGRN